MATLTVFLSHASEDLANVSGVAEELEECGIPCWVAPRNIALGKPYPEEIVRGLKSSFAAIVFWSEHAAQSEFVNREVERANSLKLRLFVIRLDETPFSSGTELILASIQHLRFRDWPNGACARLIAQLQAQANQPVQVGHHRQIRKNRFALWSGAFAIVLVVAYLTYRFIIPSTKPDIAPQTSTPKVRNAADFAATFFQKLGNHSEAAEIFSLFSPRARGFYSEMQFAAFLATARANTESFGTRTIKISESAPSRLIDAPQTGEYWLQSSERKAAEMYVCEFIILSRAKTEWWIETYLYWPSKQSCVDQRQIVAAKMAAKAFAIKLVNREIQKQDLDPNLTATPELQQQLDALLLTESNFLANWTPSELIGAMPTPPSMPNQDASIIVRFAVDQSGPPMNLQMILRSSVDGRWQLTQPPILARAYP